MYSVPILCPYITYIVYRMKTFRCVLPKPHEMVSISFGGIRIAPNDKTPLVCLWHTREFCELNYFIRERWFTQDSTRSEPESEPESLTPGSST